MLYYVSEVNIEIGGGEGAQGKPGRNGGTFSPYNILIKIMVMWKFCQPILSLGV